MSARKYTIWILTEGYYFPSIWSFGTWRIGIILSYFETNKLALTCQTNKQTQGNNIQILFWNKQLNLVLSKQTNKQTNARQQQQETWQSMLKTRLFRQLRMLVQPANLFYTEECMIEIWDPVSQLWTGHKDWILNQTHQSYSSVRCQCLLAVSPNDVRSRWKKKFSFQLNWNLRGCQSQIWYATVLVDVCLFPQSKILVQKISFNKRLKIWAVFSQATW